MFCMHEQMKRLYEAAKVLKRIYGQSELARAINASPQTIHNWQERGISKQGMLKAQEVIGCSALWLETGNGPMSLNVLCDSSPLFSKTSQIPLIRPDQALKISSKAAAPVPGDPLGWLFTHTNLSSRAFALEVSGNSMQPVFQDGDWIILDPVAVPEPGDFVVAKCGAKKELVLRKYRPKGLDTSGNMTFELVPLNEDYPSLRSDIVPIEVIGTLIEHRIFTRKPVIAS